MLTSNEYPIAETFDSLQGEGGHAGVRMHFIRFAGCNVGVYTKPEALLTEHPVLAILRDQNPAHSVCTSALGTSFLCDTNYKMTERVSAENLLAGVKAYHICLTGGEPLMHDLMPLLLLAADAGLMVHIETSGTLPIPKEVGWRCNIVCSPKAGFLPGNIRHIDEWKFVVDASLPPDATVAKIDAVIQNSSVPVYLQGLNANETLDLETSRYAIDIILSRRPGWRLTFQSHKLFNLR